MGRVDSQVAFRVCSLGTDGSAVLAGGLQGARLLRKVDDRWIAQDLSGIDTEIRYLVPDTDGAIWLSGNYTGVFRVRLGATPDAPPSIERFDTAAGLPRGRIVPLRLP